MSVRRASISERTDKAARANEASRPGWVYVPYVGVGGVWKAQSLRQRRVAAAGVSGALIEVERIGNPFGEADVLPCGEFQRVVFDSASWTGRRMTTRH